jgi:prolyl-tRNA editing enzyme YbaK/EbsC (Cys-tRNA(Pro) deacylase)
MGGFSFGCYNRNNELRITMALEAAIEHLKEFNVESRIQVFEVSSATVELAALAIGVEPERIAKTLAFRDEEGALLVVTAGDAKIDNAKFKSQFGMKARMLNPEETLDRVGHGVGGVCPFGVKADCKVYLDQSMRRFETVFPAVGSSNSAIELDLEELEEVSKSLGWIDVCKLNTVQEETHE